MSGVAPTANSRSRLLAEDLAVVPFEVSVGLNALRARSAVGTRYGPSDSPARRHRGTLGIMATRFPHSTKKARAAAQREEAIAAASALIAVLDPDNARTNGTVLTAAIDAVLGALGQRAAKPRGATSVRPATKTAAFHDVGLTLISPWPLPDEEQPACSRRIHLKSRPRMTLRHLHDVIQAAFSWEDRHLAAFSDAPGARRFLAQSAEDEFGEDHAPLFEAVKLDDVLTPGRVLFYTYDFGDDWWLRIEHHGVVDGAAKARQVLVDAVGISPPEDCGGVSGFMRLCRAWIRHQQGLHLDDDDTQLLAWAGPRFTVELDIEALRRSFDRPG